MRLCPPSPTNIPRVVGPGGITILGDFFAEGTYIGVPNFTVFRNEAYFDQPHKFLPERWVVDPETGRNEEDVKRAQAAFKPFSLGPRHCIAQRLALKEISYAIAKIVYMFDIEIVGTSGELPSGFLPGTGAHIVMEQFDVFTSLEKGPDIRFCARNGEVKLQPN